MSESSSREKIFTRYEVFIIALVAFIQFSVVLDFMVISPLGVILMDTLRITPSKFSIVVSAYAFAAGASGLLSAGFADRFDRKKLLLFFYSGFLLGTILCAIATTFHFLLIARIVTGIFGGVIGSIGFAIITDLFRMEVRGRVMGYVQMSFSASQVIGIPVGLLLANHFGWQSSFWFIAAMGLIGGGIMLVYMKPVDSHLRLQKRDVNPVLHLFKTVSKPRYIYGFLTMSMLASGGFMLMPFGSTFGTNNLGLTMAQLPVLYLITGVFSIAVGPIVGKLSDSMGKFKLFTYSSIAALVVIIIYTNLGITPFWLACLVSVLLFAAITARMIPAGALMTAIPAPEDRGAFMSVNAASMQIAGGLASVAAGRIVGQAPSGMLLHYDILGYVVAGLMIIMVGMMHYVDRMIRLPVAAEAHLSSVQPLSAEMT